VSLVLRTEKQINSSKSYHRLLLCYEIFENKCDSRSPQLSQSSINNSSLWSTVHLELVHISTMVLNVEEIRLSLFLKTKICSSLDVDNLLLDCSTFSFNFSSFIRFKSMYSVLLAEYKNRKKKYLVSSKRLSVSD